MESTTIHGHTVKYDGDKHDDHIASGIRYLNNLSFNEAEKIFKEAKSGGSMSASFKNSSGSSFKLKVSGGSYTLSYRGY